MAWLAITEASMAVLLDPDGKMLCAEVILCMESEQEPGFWVHCHLDHGAHDVE